MNHRQIPLPEHVRYTRTLNDESIIGIQRVDKSTRVISIDFNGEPTEILSTESSCSFADHPDWRSPANPPSKLTWIFLDQSLIGIAADGSVASRISLVDVKEINIQADEEIGMVYATADGLFLSINWTHTNTRREPAKHELTPRVIKLSTNGDLVWEVKLPVSEIGYRGVAEMTAANNWKLQEKKPWRPRSWMPFGHDLLITSGDRILATFAEASSGIGCRYVLDNANGKCIWQSPPGPGGYSTPMNPGDFLIGDFGYDAFQSTLLCDDKETTTWPSQGQTFLLGDQVCSVQMDNAVSHPQFCVELKEDGSVIKVSQRLGGFYTSAPQRMDDGNVYFWRGDKIWQWTPQGEVSPIHSTDYGKLAFARAHKFSDQRIGFNIRYGGSNRERVLQLMEI